MQTNCYCWCRLVNYSHCNSFFYFIKIGVAGLTIAYELTLAGHEVIVYEASDRAGGRLFTYDTGNTIIELGGMRFPLDIHTLTDTYIKKRFHLPLEPFVSYNPNTFIYINGIKHRSDNTSFLPNEYNLQVDLDEQNKVCNFYLYESYFFRY
jgi:monoamine oxidase